jgi:hypothetical protein
MSDTEAVRISSLKYVGDYKLRIRWLNGKTMPVDLQEPIFRVKEMSPLRIKEVFAEAGKGDGGHSIVWPGEVDMGADRLWEMTLEQGRADAD